jgi:hypothetical protein
MRMELHRILGFACLSSASFEPSGTGYVEYVRIPPRNEGEGFMRKLLVLLAALIGTLAIAVTPGSAVTGDFVKDFEHP